MGVFTVSLILGIIILWSSDCVEANTYNVLQYGAVNGSTIDNSHAFADAWKAACESETQNPTVVIPKSSSFLVNPMVFSGPCKANTITFLVRGSIVAPASPDAWKGLKQSQWLAFEDVSGLNVAGYGLIDGSGMGWWNQSCKYHPYLSMNLLWCNGSSISNIRFINSSQTHILIRGSEGIMVKNLVIRAPGNSPNTDGIHIQSSHNVIIKETIIGTGDDCISIGDYTSNVDISDVRCGPGHGISIGSLGKGGNFVQVENINVSKVYFKGTTNGARIKTWQVGRGFVRRIVFEDLYFNSVRNPLIIDQNYCSVKGACKEEQTGVQIEEVMFSNFFGTSTSNVAITLNYSTSVPCTNILFKFIFLISAKTGQKVTSSCANAYGNVKGIVQPQSCLQLQSKQCSSIDNCELQGSEGPTPLLFLSFT